MGCSKALTRGADQRFHLSPRLDRGTSQGTPLGTRQGTWDLPCAPLDDHGVCSTIMVPSSGGDSPDYTPNHQRKGHAVEITIKDGTVSRIRNGADAPVNPRAVQARTIANHLGVQCERIGAKVVHNEDAGYTGIRFDPKGSQGPIVLQMPTEKGGNFFLIQEFIEADEKGRTEIEMRHFPNAYKAQGIALMVRDYLHSRGFLARASAPRPSA